MTPRAKWRPSLWMVVFGVVLTVALTPLAALFAILALETWLGWDFEFHTIWDAGPVLIVTVLAALVLSYVASRTLLGPVMRLIERTDEIERGHADAFRPLEHYGTREFALLGDRFGRLARRLSQRNDDLSLFSRHLGHELKSPLSAIRGAAELLRDGDMKAVQRERFSDNILADADRLVDLADRLRELAFADTRPVEGACEVRAIVEAEAKAAGVGCEIEGHARVAMGAEALGIVMRQLAVNAAQAGATALRIGIDADHDDGLVVRVTVGDDGSDMARDERLLEAFHTTRRDDGGTGLGLSIARGLLRRHGGELRFASEDQAKFEITLPAASGPDDDGRSTREPTRSRFARSAGPDRRTNR